MEAKKHDGSRLFYVIGRLLREARPIWKQMALSCLLCCVVIAMTVLGPTLMGQVTNEIYEYWANPHGNLLAEITPTLLLLLAVYAIKSTVGYGKFYLLSTSVSRHFTCTIRIRMSEKIQRLPVKFVDGTPVGDILERMTDDVSSMGNSLHKIIDLLMEGVLQILVISVSMLLEDWRLGLIVILTTPLSVLLSVKIAGRSNKPFDEMFLQNADIYTTVEESYTNFATAKAYNLEKELKEKHKKTNQLLAKAQAKANFIVLLVTPVITFFNGLTYILLNLAGGYLVVKGKLPISVVVTVILFARQFSSPLEQISGGFGEMQHAAAAALRVLEFLDQPEEDPRQGTVDPERVRGEVTFSHVDFSYDPQQPLIQDLTFTAHTGQTVAIVGPTGAGKTTIVNLLMSFYDIQKGEITIDGRPLSQMSRDEARKLFSMVLQETWLFRGTVAENVSYGRPDATKEEIEAACGESYCDHFIRTLPKGYDTVIGDEATILSGGQKQLLTIARAVLAGRRLLILDEATSNVDTRTEILIQKAMDRLMADRTCFVIAHRLSTIVHADLILVIQDGKIVEQGTHRQLLEQKGFYARLYASQYDQTAFAS